MSPESLRNELYRARDLVGQLKSDKEELYAAARSELERHIKTAEQRDILVAENRKLSAENARLQARLALLRERNADLEMDRAVNPSPSTQ